MRAEAGSAIRRFLYKPEVSSPRTFSSGSVIHRNSAAEAKLTAAAKSIASLIEDILNVTQLNASSSDLFGVLKRHKLVRKEPVEFQIGNGRRDRAPIEFLCAIEFMTARNAASVKMTNVI